MNSSEPQRIYLDNAATSFPKPNSVVAAVTKYMTQCGVAVGEGLRGRRQNSMPESQPAGRDWRGYSEPPRPHEISFAFNGTDSLNLAIHGCLAPRRPCRDDRT